MKFKIEGMTCAACVLRVEKAVKKVTGVNDCNVNLLSNSMNVYGNASALEIKQAVENAGYRAFELHTTASVQETEDLLKDTKTSLLKKRLVISLLFLCPLLYFSMFHMMFNAPIPDFFTVPEKNHVAMGLLQMILAGIVLVINQEFFISGFKGLLKFSPNMDSLVSLGAGASYIYSIAILFCMTRVQILEGTNEAEKYMDEFFFEGAAAIVTFITVGKLLESISKGKTTNALKKLICMAPKKATLIIQGKEIETDVDKVKTGDIFTVKPGEKIPVDGEILEGSSSVDESLLTGESIPVNKEPSNSVSASTINIDGFLKCKATRVGNDSTLFQIIQMVSEASATKAPIAKIADKVSCIFVPSIIILSLITLLVWLVLGYDFGFALARGITVLVISCPCALGLATPVAVMVSNGVGAKNGILFKNAMALENAGNIQIAVLDKTGTITNGTPKVVDVIPSKGVLEQELLQTAFDLEVKSEHPLASAIVEKCSTLGLQAQNVFDFEVHPGNGLQAKEVNSGKFICGGNLKFISNSVPVPDDIKTTLNAITKLGQTPVLFAKNGSLLGLIALADHVKEDSKKAVQELKDMGIRVFMLTGDNKHTAHAIGDSVHINDIIAEVLPGEKQNVIKELKKYGKVAMVGDGINDAPALSEADIGIAIGKGSDVAIDSAAIVLMKSRLTDVSLAIRLSKQTLLNIKENLFFAFIYNILGIPLAAGYFYSILGYTLNATFAAIAMSLSSFCVITNALRLNFFDLKKVYKNAKVK